MATGKHWEYAIYIRDEFQFIGTTQECAKRLGVSEKTVYFYSSPTYLKRTNGNGYVAVRLLIRNGEVINF